MHSILNLYYNYAVEKGGETLLPQYLAMYKITVCYTLNYTILDMTHFVPTYINVILNS